MNFIRHVPDGAILTLESSMRHVLPINMMAIAMGLHVRCGIEDDIWTPDHKSTVSQVEQLLWISREFVREIATGREAREIYRVDESYDSVDVTLAKVDFSPNRKPGQRGSKHHA